MAQQGLFGFALALVVSVTGCTFGSAVGNGAGGSGSTGASTTGASEDEPADATAPATSSGDRGGGQDEGTTVGISGTAGSTSDASTTGDDDDDDDDDDESTSSSTGEGTTSGDDTSGGTTAAPLSCDELFMTAPGYVYCDETPTTCSFNANTNGTCDAMCASLDSECVAAFDNPNSAGQECDVIRPNRDTCGTVRGTEICECTRL